MSDAQTKRFTECSSLHQMMLIVFSKILRLRKYYEECYFFQHQIHGVTVSIIDMTNPFVNHLIANSIMGAASAADKRYLESVQLIFKLLNDRPERFVERFLICFDEDNNPELVSPTRRAQLSPVPDQCWNREDIVQMSKSVDEICRDLDHFPPDDAKVGGMQVSFRLDYNFNCPKGYTAPYFERSNFPRLKFSELLPAIPIQRPPPVRSLSEKDDKVRSILSVQSLLTRGNSLPPSSRAASTNATMEATRTDTSVGSPFRKWSRSQSKEASQAPRQPRQPVMIVEEDGDKDEDVVEEEEVSDEDNEGEEVSDEDEEEERVSGEEKEDEEELEEIETTRGEADGDGRKRSIDEEEEEGERKKARSTSTSPIYDEALAIMNRSYNLNATLLSSSMAVGEGTLLKPDLSPDSPEMLSVTVSSPSENRNLMEEEEDDDEEGRGSQEDLNETIESDGGEELFVN